MLKEQHFTSLEIFKSLKIFLGSCKGDSGGPLLTQNQRNRRTLSGIVSGGVECGTGIPGWYTDVSFYADWIKCIINRALILNNNQEKVQRECEKVAKAQPKCIKSDDRIFGDLRGIDADLDTCKPANGLTDVDSDYDIRQGN